MPPSLGTTRHLHSSYFPTSYKGLGSPGLDVPLLPRPREESLGKDQAPARQGGGLPGAGGQGQPKRGGGWHQTAPPRWQIVAIGSGHPTPGAGP